MDYSLIANSGIQILNFSFSIDLQDRTKMWFREWHDQGNGLWCVEQVNELRTEDGDVYYYRYQDLLKEGFLASDAVLDVTELQTHGIKPLRINEENCIGVEGEFFPMSFSSRDNSLATYENVWLPIPYFKKRTSRYFAFAPVNWARMMLVPKNTGKQRREYEVLLAFDTRTIHTTEDKPEYPSFVDEFKTEMDFALCKDTSYLLDYCSSGKDWSYVDNYLMHLVHPDANSISDIKGSNTKRTAYIASYVFLIKYLADSGEFPEIKLYKGVEQIGVDMVIDIGNSRTTALLVEDGRNFNQVRQLELIDYTQLIKKTDNGFQINKYSEPFDMRLAFRKADFGEQSGLNHKSKQFVYPSLVRLGSEANYLIHQATNSYEGGQKLSTYSSPKRYLWDGNPNREEWEFLLLPGERGNTKLDLEGITNQLHSDGTIARNTIGGITYNYSRRSLMTFAFLEMLTQARTQINSIEYRSNRTGFGNPHMARRIKRIIVTCPTAMSKLEREALVSCAKDAVILLENFDTEVAIELASNHQNIEVIPAVAKHEDEQHWYYDEATCSQLVYIYGEVGYKYKGICSEFFNLYGKNTDGDSQKSITIGSLDIGAGTSDLMISKYSYHQGDITTLIPDPQFYDSYYFAGDDMLYHLIKEVMIMNLQKSSFRKELYKLSDAEYLQRMKNFFGPDYNGPSVADRTLRKDFNIQYSVPLMSHFLELLKNGIRSCGVTFEEVFRDCPPNPMILERFQELVGIDLTRLEWAFDAEYISEVIRSSFKPLLEKVATIMYAHACDIILLSGRPASLSPIRDLFLMSYAVSPNRLIVLNDYYVGDWYPFGENTGHIKNAKTIVAMGGVLGFYASNLANLSNFELDLSLLRKNLTSTINYIEASRDNLPIQYFITPEQNRGELKVASLPLGLKVRQLEIDSYPERTLYTIDFNRHKIANSIIRSAIAQGQPEPTRSQAINMAMARIETLKKRMPFTITIERAIEDKEDLRIVDVVDKYGETVSDSDLEIHIQSLGVSEQYWLDSGAFNF